MSITENIEKYRNEVGENRLVAVSKTKPESALLQAYEAGQRKFGENRVQELSSKHESLPKDIEWHMIGHLQSNKVKFIAPFVTLIHAVDSEKLLKEIQKQAAKNNRKIACLLQMHIAEESAKFGFENQELIDLVSDQEFFDKYPNVEVQGLMGMATFTSDEEQVRKEFISLRKTFESINQLPNWKNNPMTTLSMGMSGDYKIAIEEGSTLVRIGSAIFGSR